MKMNELSKVKMKQLVKMKVNKMRKVKKRSWYCKCEGGYSQLTEK